ncbi:hypothetical protein OC834_004429 [Tilletia horrida]|uniref:Roadblock/LAMTOR2 domain-containing protein n=1 Tax=Tilletia horrida TaxID=155126 RepID=A0AAN6GE24_9BASI|nr:hypothetical protein OC834_004429 [Tilletia horrida]KAK0531960.1 hypothetical protein OC835_003490 [Tilletia horrida]KAK0536485.1 hypothetical protein OC842_001975 [Tilletia horrida]KAK0566693.1 hypothetical protein OC844_000599 [Tilletia horrida]
MSASPTSASADSPAPSLHARLDPAAIASHPYRKQTIPGSPMPPSSSLLPDEFEAASADVTFASAAGGEDDEDDEDDDDDDEDEEGGTGARKRTGQGRGTGSGRKGGAAPPPEVEHTLSKLTSHKNVTGCLILSRPETLIIRAEGPAFEPGGPGALERSDRLVKVVRMVRRVVDVMTKEVAETDEGDDLGFVRIRTKKYEMLISPSEKYLLVVLQDPTIAP